MATLSGSKVKETFAALLKLETNDVTSTLKTVEDGAGNNTALKLSTDLVGVAGLAFTSSPSISPSETTAMFLDGSNNVVVRELGAGAFAAANTSTQPEVYVQRIENGYSVTTSSSTPTMATVDNTNNLKSHHVNNDNPDFEISNSTTGAIKVTQGGLVRVDLSLFFEVTSTNTDITIILKEKDTASQVTVVNSSTRSKASTGNMSAAYSFVRYVTDNTDIYYEVSINSGGGASMLTPSIMSLTKLN